MIKITTIDNIYEVLQDTTSVEERCEIAIKLIDTIIKDNFNEYYIIFLDNYNVPVQWSDFENFCIKENLDFDKYKKLTNQCFDKATLYLEVVDLEKIKINYPKDKFPKDVNNYTPYGYSNYPNRFRIYNRDIAMDLIKNYSLQELEKYSHDLS